MAEIYFEKVKCRQEIADEDIRVIYQKEFLGSNFDLHVVRRWEQIWYLENYLISCLQSSKDKLKKELGLSIMSLLNIKQLEQINFWDSLRSNIVECILSLFNYVINSQWCEFELTEKYQIINFMMAIYSNPEQKQLSSQCYQYLSGALLLKANNLFLKWHFLKYPSMIDMYIDTSKIKGIAKSPKSCFFHELVQDLIQTILTYPVENVKVQPINQQSSFKNLIDKHQIQTIEDVNQKQIFQQLLYRKISDEQLKIVKYIEKFIDFMILLLSSIPTRRCLRVYLLSHNVLPLLKCTLPSYHSNILATLLDLFEHYLNYPLDDDTGEQMPRDTQILVQKDFHKQLSTALFKKYNLVISSKDLETNSFVKNLTINELKDLFLLMNLIFPQEIPPQIYSPGKSKFILIQLFKKDFNNLIIEVIKAASPTPILQQKILTSPVIPNETMIWDYKRIPEESSLGILKQVLALPKLNLQFLSIDDYLERNYWLYKLESAFDLRKDFEDAIQRIAPRGDGTFDGWARMATEVKKFRVHQVQEPLIGSRKPRRVYAEIQYNNEKMAQNVKREWDQLKKHDVVFLVSFNKIQNVDQQLIDEIEDNKSCRMFCQKHGIQSIRGAEIDVQYDERRIVTENGLQGAVRVIYVNLDCVQYQEDIESGINIEGEIYGNFKLLIRRRPKENNFKAVLQSIMNLIEIKPKLPDFLNEIILGYSSKNEKKELAITTTLLDTFVDEIHLKEYLSQVQDQYHQENFINDERKLRNMEKRNNIRFTKNQVDAIISSLQEGLTLIVGPPGTGKTDVAVQIVNLLYHNFPKERTIVITHSNHALNDIFEKISYLCIDEKHLLRLGVGEKDLKLKKEFSRQGRINYMLQKRIDLLKSVSKLQQCLKQPFAEEFTCETAELFRNLIVNDKWNDPKFQDQFDEFIKDSPELFSDEIRKFYQQHNESYEERAFQEYCLQKLFEEIQECRAFEILRNKKERGNYVICKQARIIAMTCTHAALKRQAFVDLNFEYDNVIFEEAGQILEIEAFLPLTMQRKRPVKRIIMIGDHNQLPPVIKNVSFQKIANLEQSFFMRMIRLGLPHHVLQHQGRSRIEMLPLFQWKYENLDTLECCRQGPYQFANAGFQKVYQFVNVSYNGQGESRPAPYIYQNLEEAEFVVATYMYLILIGYNPNQISILTTYNGQKLLIRDIINKKCSWHSLFKTPFKITTVDKYQGQQNDIILLSMVRTEYAGYLRDARRMIVALSRAKFGLYIFGKYDLFSKLPEIKQSFKYLEDEPLRLIIEETHPTTRRVEDQVNQARLVNTSEQMYNVVKELLSRQVA